MENGMISALGAQPGRIRYSRRDNLLVGGLQVSKSTGPKFTVSNIDIVNRADIILGSGGGYACTISSTGNILELGTDGNFDVQYNGFVVKRLAGGVNGSVGGTIASAQVWNNAAVQFKALTVNTTDTASLASSLLLDLQVGGTSKFSIDKLGNITTMSAENSSLNSMSLLASIY